jgi:IclR family acetate operon transcriptional repressor
VGTVSKALSLLDHFNGERPEASLAEITKLSGFDKATTRRLLLELAAHGFVEQNPATRGYRIGPGPLRLARLRAEQFPLIEVARPIVEELTHQCGETVHLSELIGGALSTILVAESPKASRVSVPLGQMLPFNCTASGIALIAFGPEEIRKTVLGRRLQAVTSSSITDPALLAAQAAKAREAGYATSDQGYEEGVFSVAAPILALDGVAFGAVSVASPTQRVTPDTVAAHGAAAREAAARISAGLFGRGAR